MQQLLAAQGIPARVVAQGSVVHLGSGVPSALQVHSQDQWTALLLLSPIEENGEDGSTEFLE